MINYFYDCYSILNKVYSDKAFVKQAINSTVIEEKNRALTVKSVYGVLDKDIELSYYLSKLCDKSPKLVIRTIIKISMYAIKYLGKKEYAVVKNAVELTKKLGKSGASGFVNALLRKFIKTDFEFPTEDAEYLSVKYSYPLFAVKELLSVYGKDRTESILGVSTVENTLFFPEIDGEKYLIDHNVKYRKTPFDKVFLVENFVRNNDYDDGTYTFQALGSVAICDIVDSCENLLDCCAAPGGKSINLSYKCNSVTSWDVHPHRVELINDYKKRMRRNNVKTNVIDAKVFIPQLKDSFDAVLCDAPCSGMGVVLDNPDIKLNRTKDDVISLNKEQSAILNNVSKYLKVGGYLYYSTCSVLKSENIDIITEFLNNNKNYKIEKITSKLPHEDCLGANAFMPDISFGQGFFVAKLKRIS